MQNDMNSIVSIKRSGFKSSALAFIQLIYRCFNCEVCWAGRQLQRYSIAYTPERCLSQNVVSRRLWQGYTVLAPNQNVYVTYHWFADFSVVCTWSQTSIPPNTVNLLPQILRKKLFILFLSLLFETVTSVRLQFTVRIVRPTPKRSTCRLQIIAKKNVMLEGSIQNHRECY